MKKILASALLCALLSACATTGEHADDRSIANNEDGRRGGGEDRWGRDHGGGRGGERDGDRHGGPGRDRDGDRDRGDWRSEREEGRKLLAGMRMGARDNRAGERLDAQTWAIMMCVEDGDLRVDEFEVEFGNGQKQDIRTRDFIRRGECTKWRDLAKGMRNVKRVVVKGRSEHGSTIRVWGRESRFNFVASGEVGRNREDDFEAEGEHRSIKVCSREGNVAIRRFEVKFGNGEWQRFNLGDNFLSDNECTRWMDLEGGNRNIKKVRVEGFTRGMPALVEVFGRR